MGIVNPSPIQEKAIPFLLTKGTDFIGKAQTGTGKTAAFGLPLLHRVNPAINGIQALVLAPTRELCQQIAKQLFRYTKYSDKIFATAVYGGEKIDLQINRLRRPTQIIVATPGRLIELLEKKALSIEGVRTVVLDEADEMLSMGFKKELDEILKQTTGKRHTWLFSATMPEGIRQIIGKYMASDATKVEINRSERVNSSITHQYVVGEEFEKADFLSRFLKIHAKERGIIFCRTKSATQELARTLKDKKLLVDVIHGDLKQIERDKVMRSFKNDKIHILVATDISARGIDMPDLAYVIHYQLPDQLEYYTHRSGRTGRAGRQGLSIAFITPHEISRMKEIEKELNITIKRIAT